jgi:hypothetical protein
MAKRQRKQQHDDDDDDSKVLPLDDFQLEPDDCGVFHTLTGTAWGANKDAAKTAADAEGRKYLKALKVICSNRACPVPKKSMSTAAPEHACYPVGAGLRSQAAGPDHDHDRIRVRLGDRVRLFPELNSEVC